MSGDVQPRKRKDKKRRKDDIDPVPVQVHPPVYVNNSVSDDVNIHVHKEGGTGGNICAKLVFFVLFSALAVLIGLIITEHRGLTDLDSVEAGSKYSHIFEGLVDSAPDDHEDHDIEEALTSHEADLIDDHEDKDEEFDDSDVEDEEETLSEEYNKSEGDQSEEEEDHADELEEKNDSALSEEQDDDGEVDEDIEEDDIPVEDDELSEDVDEDDNPAEDDEEIDDTVDDSDEEYDQDEKDDGKQTEVATEEVDEDETEDNEYVVEENDEEAENNDDQNEDNDDDDEEIEDNVDADKNEVDEEELIENKVETSEDDNDDYKDDLDHSSENKQEVVETIIERKDSKSEGETEQESDVQESSSRTDFQENMAENSDSDSERQSDDEEYQIMNITNKDDFQIRNEIDEAQKSVDSNPSYAVKLFDAILRKHPSSPRSLYGKAISLDALADEKQSNAILEKALTLYREILDKEDIPPALYKLVTDRCIKRMRFIGHYQNLLKVHSQVIERFPDEPKFRNELVVTYLTINRIENARSVLREILSRWPNDGYALVHYGFILKTTDNNLEEAVEYLSKGLKTGADGVEDGRFYFQLGDALTRLGRKEEANKVFEKGAEKKVFLSKHQRSLYNVPRLTGNPWWQKENIQNPLLFNLLEQYWQEIRREGLSVLNEKGYFRDESENLKDTGDWKQFELYARGRKNLKNCQKCPVTCSIIDRIPEAKFCKRGQTKFSVMHPGTHVWPHCGPTNCRLRTHLGLVVPPKTFLRVADDVRSWDEGAVIVFDDSFEHEVWHNGTGIRLVLIVDIWHPELTLHEKNSLSAI